MKQSAR